MANSQWDDLPVDRLRFEHEKRQREISNLHREISDKQRQYDQAQQEWGDAYGSAANDGVRGIHNFDASGYQRGTEMLFNEIGRLQGKVSTLRSEMQEIEKVLNEKWK